MKHIKLNTNVFCKNTAQKSPFHSLTRALIYCLLVESSTIVTIDIFRVHSVQYYSQHY